MFYKNKKNQKGFGLLEIVIGLSLISVSFFALFLVSQMSLKVSGENLNIVKASFLAEEGLEAIRVFRDSGWDTYIGALNVDSDYYFEFNGITWLSTTTNAYIDGIFERKFVLSSVYRNAADDISVSGTPDPNTKKITVFISWLTRSGTTTRSISTYLSNLFEN